MNVPHISESKKPLLFVAFALVCAFTSIAIFHHKAKPPTATIAECRTADDCRTALDAQPPASRDGILLPEPSEECKTLQAQALAICSTEFENRVYDGGEMNYTRGDREKDIPLCMRISDAVLHSCTSYERGNQ